MTDCRLRDKVWASFHCSLQGSLQSGPRPSRFPALFFTPHFVLNGSRFLSPRPALAATATLCCPHARGRDQAPLLHLPHCCQGATLPSHSLSGLASPGLSPQTHWFHLPPLLLQHLAPGWRMVNIWDRKKGGRENGGPMARCCWRPGKRRADHTHTHTQSGGPCPSQGPTLHRSPDREPAQVYPLRDNAWARQGAVPGDRAAGGAPRLLPARCSLPSWLLAAQRGSSICWEDLFVPILEQMDLFPACIIE